MALADDYAPCGAAGSYVYVGDTEARLLASCGQPTQVREYLAPKVSTVEKVRWAYTQNYSITNSSGAAVNLNAGAQYVVEFTDQKITQIYIAGLPYHSFDDCGPIPGIHRTITVGDSMSTVRSQCGAPAFADEIKQEQKGEPIPATEYIYQRDPSLPPTVVTIENGIVVGLN
jgi:hypothetical protein